MARVTLESVAKRPQGKAMAGGGNTGKSPSADADESGERGCHGARQAQRGENGGRQGNSAGKTLGVWVDGGGREASGVAHKSPGVEDEGGGGTKPPEW